MDFQAEPAAILKPTEQNSFASSHREENLTHRTDQQDLGRNNGYVALEPDDRLNVLLFNPSNKPRESISYDSFFGNGLMKIHVMFVVVNIIAWSLRTSQYTRLEFDRIARQLNAGVESLEDFSLVIFLISFYGYSLLIFIINWLMLTEKCSSSRTRILVVLSPVFYLLSGIYWKHVYRPTLTAGLIVGFFIVVAVLKGASFSHFCYKFHQVKQTLVSSPKISSKTNGNLLKNQTTSSMSSILSKQITFSSFFYFIASPTLCYQLEYPRTQKIRCSFVAIRAIETISYCSYMFFTSQTILYEVVLEFPHKFGSKNAMDFLLFFVKMSCTSIGVFIATFFFLFDGFCNLLAELVGFADREFYKDWWNGFTVQEFWRKWNSPIQNFLFRHVYSPLISRKCPSLVAKMIVFIISGLGHDYAFSLGTGRFNLWVTFFEVFQAPLMVADYWVLGKLGLRKTFVANFLMFFSMFGLFLNAVMAAVTSIGLDEFKRIMDKV